MTVINPLQDATVEGTVITPGYALGVAYRRKMSAAAEDCSREGIALIPLDMESLGGRHKVAVKEVRKLGVALGRHTGQEEGEAVSHLFQRLSILLVKGNAALFSTGCQTTKTLVLMDFFR